MRAGILTLALSIALSVLLHAQDAPLRRYSAIVDQYRGDPERVRADSTALAPAELDVVVGGAAAKESGWAPAQLQAAMLMHLEAALLLAGQRDDRMWAHIRSGQALGEALGRDRDQAWFVHRWYTLVTRLFHDDARLTPIRRAWMAFAWNSAIDSFEDGLRFEYKALTPPRGLPGLSVRALDSSELRGAVANFERAAAAGVSSPRFMPRDFACCMVTTRRQGDPLNRRRPRQRQARAISHTCFWGQWTSATDSSRRPRVTIGRRRASFHMHRVVESRSARCWREPGAAPRQPPSSSARPPRAWRRHRSTHGGSTCRRVHSSPPTH